MDNTQPKCKTSNIYLFPREVRITNIRVNWDFLVDEVFKDEVDQLMIENGVEQMYIRKSDRVDLQSTSKPYANNKNRKKIDARDYNCTSLK